MEGDRSDSASSVLEPGTTIEHFKVMRLIGRGGMGEVYLVRDTRLGRRAALKIIGSRSLRMPGARAAFQREAETTARFSHPNIVQVHAVGEYQGRPFVALEYLEGENLATRIKERQLGLTEALRIGLAVALALAEAHRHGVLHLDLKPANVVMATDGRPRVVDFGLSVTAEAGTTSPTSPTPDGSEDARVWGTPAYTAPERWRKAAPDAAADVWGLGVILYEMCTRRLPFDAHTLAEGRALIVGPEPAPRLDANVEVPRELADLVARCLAKDPSKRPRAAEVARELEDLLGTRRASTASDDGPFRGLAAFDQRHAHLFFGRDAEVDAFVERLRERPVLAVVGPSGAGKSSFVQAGIIPRLREQEPWIVLQLLPGAKPFANLADRLRRRETQTFARSGEIVSEAAQSLASGARVVARRGEISGKQETVAFAGTSDVATRLFENPRSLSLALRTIAEEERSKVLLVVDQLEELFTLVDDPHDEVRQRFLEAIFTAADDPSDPVRVIVAVRDDFLGRLSIGPEARDALAQVTVVQRLGRAALEDVLKKPVAAVGYRWEDDDVVREMAAAVADEPGSLPLLQFAGETLWNQRDEERRLLLRSAYERMGGIEGALARHADAVLDDLSPAQRRIARELMLMLVTPERTRKIVAFDKLRAALPADAEPVLARLMASRLLAVTRVREAASTGPRLQLAHESLIRTWTTLARWIDESREELAFLADAKLAAELWDKRGRRPEELWLGDALRDASRMLARVDDVPASVDRFIAACRARERRRVRRRRVLFASVIASALVVAATAIGVALFVADKEREARRERNEAEAQREAARRQEGVAHQQRAVAQREGARAALGQGRVLEARAKLRMALEHEDGPTARALWWQLAADPLEWHVDIGTFGVAVAFAPDGSTLATGCHDAATCILDVDTAAVRVLRGHEQKVSAIAYAHDGRRLATGDWGNAILVWDLESGRVLHTLSGHEDRVEALEFSPDDRVLASAGRDRTVRLWDPTSGQAREILRGHVGGVEGLSFAPDGRTLATGSEDKTVRRWDVASGRELGVLAGHEGAVEDVAFAPRGDNLASGGNEGTIRIWDTKSGELVRVLVGHAGGVRGLSFSPDGRRLASGAYDNTVRVWNVASGRTERVFTGHLASVRDVAFGPDGRHLASAAYDEAVRLWNVEVEQPHPIEEGHAGAVRGVDISPDRKLVASGGFDRTVRLWDRETGEETQVLHGHTSAVYGVEFSPDGARLASAGSEGEVRIWNVASGKSERVLLGHTASAYAVAFASDGRSLATASRDRTVRLWNVDTGDLLRTLQGHEDIIWDVDIDPSGRRVAAASWDRTVRLWDARTGAPIDTLLAFDGAVYGVDFAPDGRTLATSGADGSIRQWDLATRQARTIATLPRRLHVLRHDPAGTHVAVAVSDGTVHVVALADGQDRVLGGHSDEATHLAWADDGSSLATVADDGTVRVWDMARERPHWRAPALLREPARLLSHRGWTAIDDTSPARPDAAFARALETDARYAEENPDSTIVCIETHDDRVLLWDIRSDQLAVDRRMPGLRRVAAFEEYCIAQGDEGVVAISRTSMPVLAEGATEAIGVGESGVLVARDESVEIFDATGHRTHRVHVGFGVTAVTSTASAVLVGYGDGTLAAFALDPAGPAPSDFFEQLPSGTVTRMVPGPMNTVIAGYANGTVAMWSVADGTRLARARLHGPINHLLTHRHRLFAATDLGRRLVWDLGVFHRNYCGVLSAVWSQVPVVWHDGRAFPSPPPDDHACR